MLLGGITPGCAQGVLLTLHSVVTPARLRGACGMPGIKPGSANARPEPFLLWPSGLLAHSPGPHTADQLYPQGVTPRSLLHPHGQGHPCPPPLHIPQTRGGHVRAMASVSPWGLCPALAGATAVLGKKGSTLAAKLPIPAKCNCPSPAGRAWVLWESTLKGPALGLWGRGPSW